MHRIVLTSLCARGDRILSTMAVSSVLWPGARTEEPLHTFTESSSPFRIARPTSIFSLTGSPNNIVEESYTGTHRTSLRNDGEGMLLRDLKRLREIFLHDQTESPHLDMLESEHDERDRERAIWRCGRVRSGPNNTLESPKARRRRCNFFWRPDGGAASLCEYVQRPNILARV